MMFADCIDYARTSAPSLHTLSMQNPIRHLHRLLHLMWWLSLVTRILSQQCSEHGDCTMIVVRESQWSRFLIQRSAPKLCFVDRIQERLQRKMAHVAFFLYDVFKTSKWIQGEKGFEASDIGRSSFASASSTSGAVLRVGERMLTKCQ